MPSSACKKHREERRGQDVDQAKRRDLAGSSPAVVSPAAGNRWVEHEDPTLLELVLESDSDDLRGVVLPVLAEEDGAAGARCDGRGESAGLPIGIDEALVRVEELGRPALREGVIERRVQAGQLVVEGRPAPCDVVRLVGAVDGAPRRVRTELLYPAQGLGVRGTHLK